MSKGPPRSGSLALLGPDAGGSWAQGVTHGARACPCPGTCITCLGTSTDTIFVTACPALPHLGAGVWESH